MSEDELDALRIFFCNNIFFCFDNVSEDELDALRNEMDERDKSIAAQVALFNGALLTLDRALLTLVRSGSLV